MNLHRNSHCGVNLKGAARLLALVAVVAGAAAPLTAQAVKQTGGEYNTLYAGLGAKGYDVVAYFEQGKPVQGSADHESVYGGVTWRFASKKHRDMFESDPARYAPQYGGFCSWGVAEKGRLFDVDPENGWTIHDGKLYLNFNADINRTFRSRAASFVQAADRKWPALNR
jgi:YHS domain-containing protein